MKLKVLILEDDPLTAFDLKEVLSNNNFEVVGTCKSYEESVSLYNESHPDIILADISLKGEKDGIQFVERVQKSIKPVPIIYLTGNSDQSTKSRAFRTNPAAFLTKPFNAATVVATLELAIAKNKQVNDSSKNYLKEVFFIKKGYQHLAVKLDKILFIKAEGSYCELYSEDGNHMVSGNLKTYIEKFKDEFVRCHKSYLINTRKIESVNTKNISIGEHLVPIGRQYKDRVKKLIVEKG